MEERRDHLIVSQQVHLPSSTEVRGLVTVRVAASPSARFPGAANTDAMSTPLLQDGAECHSLKSVSGQEKLLPSSVHFLGIPCNNRTFKCGNDICFRKQNAQCDGTVDCPDGSDEQGCSE